MTIFFYFVIAAYVITVIYEATETRHHSSGTPRKARWTLLLFFIVDATAVVGGLIEHHFNKEVYLVISLIGLGLIVLKVIIKRACMKTLGQYYSVHIMTDNSHRLITSGLYKTVRHPAYLAHIIGIAGIALMLNAYRVLVIASILDLVVIAVRVRLEEKELMKRFGDEYSAYAKRTWAFVPFKFLAMKLVSHT